MLFTQPYGVCDFDGLPNTYQTKTVHQKILQRVDRVNDDINVGDEDYNDDDSDDNDDNQDDDEDDDGDDTNENENDDSDDDDKYDDNNNDDNDENNYDDDGGDDDDDGDDNEADVRLEDLDNSCKPWGPFLETWIHLQQNCNGHRKRQIFHCLASAFQSYTTVHTML